MRRRDLIAGASALIACPSVVRGQHGSQVPIVAVLSPGSADMAKPRVEAIQKGLQEAGLFAGTDYLTELRVAEGKLERLPELARELESLKPAVMVVSGNLAPVRGLLPTTKVVFTAIAIDPVERGFVQSYARPGGMVTGNVLGALGGEDTIAEKRISLFKELVPSTSRLGIFGPITVAGVSGNLFGKELSAAARVASRFGFETRAYRLQTIDELEAAMASAVRDGIDSVYLSGENLLFNNFSRALPVIAAASKPTLGTYVEWARAGVLMTYAADLFDGFRRSGLYAAKVLKGENPGDLPIEQPTKFTMAINAKTANQLRISVPPLLLAQADEVIE